MFFVCIMTQISIAAALSLENFIYWDIYQA